jgi:diguanylate cyclase (GGDEF)-like protein
MTAHAPVSLLGTAAKIALLAVAGWLTLRPGTAPAAVAGFSQQAAYIALGTAALMGVVFHRGRVVFAALTIGLAYIALGQVATAPTTGIAARAVFAGACILLPAVLAAISWLHERGTLSIHAVPRLGVIAGAAGLVWWVMATGRKETLAWVYAPFADLPVSLPTPIPHLGLVAIGAGLLAIGLAATGRGSPVIRGLGWALAAFALGLHFSTSKFGLHAFTAAAGLSLVVSVLQETYRLAFRDELTGLPSRRALNERLPTLGRRYAIAMVDVDHFKNFNDAYGHDAGDQVLRMVASRLGEVSGGGTAFRYGGEEFTILFPGKSADQALPHLDTTRARVAGYRMAIRRTDRPKRRGPGKRKRSSDEGTKTVTVTVSIGVAERSGKHDTPDAVLAAADKALYEAKRMGRNRVEAD